jgi:hypothetical protein
MRGHGNVEMPGRSASIGSHYYVQIAMLTIISLVLIGCLGQPTFKRVANPVTSGVLT